MFDDEREHVVGVLLAKDLLGLANDPTQPFAIRDILRPVVFVPEANASTSCCANFEPAVTTSRSSSTNTAPSRAWSRSRTCSEQIVGDIDDEHDLAEEENIRRHRDERYTVKARTTIEEFNEFFALDWSGEAYDTIGVSSSTNSAICRAGARSWSTRASASRSCAPTAGECACCG